MHDPLTKTSPSSRGSAGASSPSADRYRIGFVDTTGSAEFGPERMQSAAERLGYTIVCAQNSTELGPDAVDFVIAGINVRQKPRDLPSFGLIRQAKIGFWDDDEWLGRLAGFDGYLTISDSVSRVLTGFGDGNGADPLIGFFELTPERQFITCQIEKLIESRAFRVCCLGAGTSEDQALPTELASRPYLRLYASRPNGAQAAGSDGYRVWPVAGQRPERVFAAFGGGLMPVRHEQDMHAPALRPLCEIVSVGAVAICPDIPWIHRHFGDTVWYYPAGSSRAAIEAIDAAAGEITAAPARAAARARAAKAIFDGTLAAEVMLQNAVGLFEAWRQRPQVDRAVQPGSNRASRRPNQGRMAASRSEASRPLISMILIVKNGMPFIGSAIESVRAQLYTNLQLVVQDCMSDDGSSELLAGIDEIEIDLVREPDGGIGDAVSRALSRCRGPIVGSIDSDNLLRPGTLHRVAEHFARFPAEAAVYGAVEMIDRAGVSLDVFRPGRFNFLRVLECELVPPWSTTFFRREALSEAFHPGASLKTCADFSAWLHLAHLPIGYIDEPLGATRLSTNSMTCNVDAYEQFCADKIEALKQYLAACKHKPLRTALLLHGQVGIYCWAAGSIAGLDQTRKDLVQSFLGRARAIAPTSARLAAMTEKVGTMNSN